MPSAGRRAGDGCAPRAVGRAESGCAPEADALPDTGAGAGALPDTDAALSNVILVEICYAPAPWHFATIFLIAAHKKWSRFATLLQLGILRPFRTAGRKRPENRHDPLLGELALHNAGVLDGRNQMLQTVDHARANVAADEHETTRYSESSRSTTQVFLMVATKCCRPSITRGRMSPPMSTSMMSSPTASSPEFNHTRT